jgi:mannose-6-phosphate isomerase
MNFFFFLSQKIITDPNHKPEMALAITPFQALCGFRPLSEIANFLNNTPELQALIPPSIVNNFLVASGSSSTEQFEKIALKTLFASLMTADESVIHHQLDILVKRYQSHATQDNDIAQLVLKLNEQFPGDIGIFCPFLLNYVRLDPGQAIFLGAGEPHAYISGGKPYYP